MTPDRALQQYQKVTAIEGWFTPQAALLFALIDELQKGDASDHGDIVEIGVHHGRSALFLAALLEGPRERLTVCDVFGRSDDNVSRSGHGNREIFMSHAAATFADLSFLTVHEVSSASLTPDVLGTGQRLFHIDGGHTTVECLSDLHLAASCLGPRGVIVLDDAFRFDWPGVTEALIRFLETSGHGFVPLVAGFNKIALIRTAAFGPFKAAMATAALAGRYFPPPWVIKNVHLLNLPYAAICGHVSNDDGTIRTALSEFMSKIRARSLRGIRRPG